LEILGVPRRRHLSLLHRLKERGLGLGRGPVDLVGQDHIGEDRTLEELEDPLPGGPVLLEDLGPGDVRRHEVGGELDAVELEVQHLGQAADHQGLGQTRHPDQKTVAVGKEGHQELVDHIVLPHDHLADLGQYLPVAVGELLQRFQVLGIGCHGFLFVLGGEGHPDS
jgi:hypothetical protein